MGKRRGGQVTRVAVTLLHLATARLQELRKGERVFQGLAQLQVALAPMVVVDERQQGSHQGMVKAPKTTPSLITLASDDLTSKRRRSSTL